MIDPRRPRGLLGCIAVSVALVASVLAGCSSGQRSSSTHSSATHSSSTQSSASSLVAPVGFRAITITITLPDGSTEQRCVWLADDDAARERGLMGVTDPGLGGRAGMVFRFPADTTSEFWMKDTLLPLSIAWFGADGAFVSRSDMEPCPAGTVICPTYAAARPYRLALEVPLGGLDQLGVAERSRVSLSAACS